MTRFVYIAFYVRCNVLQRFVTLQSTELISLQSHIFASERECGKWIEDGIKTVQFHRLPYVSEVLRIFKYIYAWLNCFLSSEIVHFLGSLCFFQAFAIRISVEFQSLL